MKASLAVSTIDPFAFAAEGREGILADSETRAMAWGREELARDVRSVGHDGDEDDEDCCCCRG